MELIQAIILGIVQGITEWWPISSSGHLVILEYFFKIKENITLNSILHLGSLLVILLVFYKDIFGILKAFFKFNFKSREGKLALYIIIGSVMTGVIGILFHDLIISFFSSIKVVAIALLITGCLLFLTQIKRKQRKMDIFDSVIIGAMQGAALVPGLSRSGTTISSGLLLGLNRKEAAKFSFLLFIPAVVGAALMELDFSEFSNNLLPISIGFLCTVIAGYLSLKYLLKIIYNRKFYRFAYYCFIVGLILLVYSLI